MKSKLIIATRSSKLALWQAEYVKSEIIKHHKNLEVELLEIKTKGDHILDTALSKIGDKGLFTKEIEEAILNNSADLAVHSLKDLPTKLPEGLNIASVLKRELPHDVLIANKNTFSSLKAGSRIGTSSLRRIAQLKSIRQDLEYIDIRGNLDTRIKKLENGEYDGIVLAFAGVKRLDLESKISYHFSPEELLPAVGQGALAIEIKDDNFFVQNIIKDLNCEKAYVGSICERAFLRKLQGGCQVPVGAYTKFENETITLYGVIADLDGKKIIKDKLSGDKNSAESIGIKLAEMLLQNGGDTILSEIHLNLR